jgi:hypothetical protein
MKRGVVYVALAFELREDAAGLGDIPTGEQIRDTVEAEWDGQSLEVSTWVYETEVLAVGTVAAEVAQSVQRIKVARKAQL